MPQWMSVIKQLSAGILLLFPAAAISVTDSSLQQFEEDVTRPRVVENQNMDSHQSPVHKKTADYDSDDSHSELHEQIDSLLVEIMIGALTYPGLYSFERVATSGIDDQREENLVTPRAVGEGVIPFARLDISYNQVSSSILALHSRAEVGYGPFGFEMRQASYSESAPDASLDVEQYHLLYRMSFGDHVELDLGLGEYTISGVAVNSGKSSTAHLLIHPNEKLGIEVRPSWATINGNGIRDHEYAISYGERFWAVCMGYRLLEGPTTNLNGPFIGVSLRY